MLCLTRAEVEALAKEFAKSYVNPNANPVLYALIHRIDAWLAAHPEKAA